MLKPRLTLPTEPDPHEAIAKATEAKRIPTIEESWEKIFSMKNSKKDKERLLLVKEWMEQGIVGREEDKLNKAFTKAEALRIFNARQVIMRQQRLDSLADKDVDKFPLLTDPATITKIVHRATQADGFPTMGVEHLVSLDTETVGEAGGVDKYRERIAGWSLTYYLDGKEQNGYIPIEHYHEVSEGVWELDPRNVDYDIAMNALIHILKSGVDTVWHNATFDMGLIYTLTGVEPVGNVHDTMIIMHLLDEELMSYKLKDLAPRYLKIDADPYEEMFGKNAKFSQVPLSIARYYAAKDTWLGYLLFKWQVSILDKPQFEKIKKSYLHIELPCIKTTFHTERTGFVMDKEEAARQKVECDERIAELEEMLAERFGDVNFGSPSQLQKLLYYDNDWSKYVTKDHKSILNGHVSFDEHGISNNGKFHMAPSGKITLDPVVKRVKKNNGTVEQKVEPRDSRNKLAADSDALEKISHHVPEIKWLIELKDLTKHLTSFVEKVPELISPDGRLHGDFRQSSTVTLRYTASNPNLQQQPYKARMMFTAPEGQLILSADFSQQEPRLAAHMSNCQGLIKLYKEARDLYSETAAAIFNKPLEECQDGSKYRKQTKVVVLAVLYGMSYFTLAGILGIPPEEGKELIDNFYKTYPELYQWIQNNEKEVRRQRYVETPWGTRRRFRNVDFNLPNKAWGAMTQEERNKRGAMKRALRQATNAKVQGSASMQTKQVMVAADQRLAKLNEARGEDVFQFLALVHDEVLYLVPDDITPEEMEEIRDVMINTVKLVVPSKTDMALGKCWGTLQEVEYVADKVYQVADKIATKDTPDGIQAGDKINWHKLAKDSLGEVIINGNRSGKFLSEREWHDFAANNSLK